MPSLRANGFACMSTFAYLHREHVEVDLILPEGGDSLPLETIVRKPCQLKGAEHFSLRNNGVPRGRIENIIADGGQRSRSPCHRVNCVKPQDAGRNPTVLAYFRLV